MGASKEWVSTSGPPTNERHRVDMITQISIYLGACDGCGSRRVELNTLFLLKRIYFPGSTSRMSSVRADRPSQASWLHISLLNLRKNQRRHQNQLYAEILPIRREGSCINGDEVTGSAPVGAKSLTAESGAVQVDFRGYLQLF